MEKKSSIANSRVGTTLDNRFTIEAILGQGGMSTVYRAQHVSLHKDVAIKVMQEQWASNADGRLRFQREAQATAALSHPNIVAVKEFGVSESGEPYMVMDYVPGESLAQLLKDHERLDCGKSLTIFKQVAAGLGHAHEKGILHRDLKPSNVMLTRSNVDNSLQVKIVDLGLARFMPQTGRDERRLTVAGELVGSPYYMSPEQIKDEELDARCDIYSFGCMMYEGLTGLRPFYDSNTISVLSMHLYEPAPAFAEVLMPCMIPAQLEAIVMRCLEKKPSKRFSSMSELLVQLESVPAWTDLPDVKVARPSSSGRFAPLSVEAKYLQGKNKGSNQPEQPGKRDEISQITGTVDLKDGFTLRLQQPELPKHSSFRWFNRICAPLVQMARSKMGHLFGSSEKSAAAPRRVKVLGTRVLVAVLGVGEDMIKEAEADAGKYKVYYKKVELRKSMNAQDFLVLLSTDQFDIVHLHGKFDDRATFKDSTNFTLRFGDMKRACNFAKVQLVWLATQNNLEWVKDASLVGNPSFHLILTGERGNNFPKFLSGLLSRFSRGELVNNAWEQYVPSAQFQGDKVSCRYIPGAVEVAFLP